MHEHAFDPPSEALVGPSRHLPWPLDAVARRAWDEASLISRRFRHSVPVPVAQVLGALLEHAQRPRVELWRAHTDSTRVLIAANDPVIRNCLFVALGLGEGARAGTLERSRLRPGSQFEAELVALEIPTLSAPPFARAGWLVLPRWVALEIDLGRPEHALWDARKRETVRLIERSGLELELARGKAAAREFYQRMYVPTATARHGKRAVVLRAEHVEAAVRAGWILFVRAGARRRAALLVVPRPGRGRIVDALMFGVAGGDYAATELEREAAYLFALRWARDVHGADRLGLTAAAPLVRDGILRFKKRWGATALADLRQSSCIAVRVQSGSPDVYRALADQPLIALCRQGAKPSLRALVLGVSGAPAARIPYTPGVDRAELALESAADLPRVIENWAKASLAP